MKLDLGKVKVNQPLGDPMALYSVPQYPGAPQVDLADPNLQFGSGPGMAQHRRQPSAVRPATYLAPANARRATRGIGD
jgi:hypothetical protein